MESNAYELIWRDFQRSLVHEVVLNWGIDPQNSERVELLRNGATHYLQANDARFFYQGFPLSQRQEVASPKHTGHRLRTKVFMDDMFMCPKCGAFKPGGEAREDDLPAIPWLNYSRTLIVDRSAMLRAIKERTAAKEFDFALCDDREHCESFVNLMKLRYDHLNREPIKVISTPSACVYLINANGFIKIGKTTNVASRLTALQTSSPVPLKVLKVWQCANADNAEKLLHGKYHRFRKSGEWFLLPNDILEELLSLPTLDSFSDSLRAEPV